MSTRVKILGIHINIQLWKPAYLHLQDFDGWRNREHCVFLAASLAPGSVRKPLREIKWRLIEQDRQYSLSASTCVLNHTHTALIPPLLSFTHTCVHVHAGIQIHVLSPFHIVKKNLRELGPCCI